MYKQRVSARKSSGSINATETRVVVQNWLLSKNIKTSIITIAKYHLYTLKHTPTPKKPTFWENTWIKKETKIKHIKRHDVCGIGRDGHCDEKWGEKYQNKRGLLQ